MTDTEAVASGHDAVWEQWRGLIRARRDGRLSETEYRRRTAELRRHLDQLGVADPDPAPPSYEPPTVPPQAPSGDREAALLGPSGVLTLVVIVAVLAAAVGFALVSLAA